MTPVAKIFPETGKRQAVHFIGIGGIGMSSLAHWFLAQNCAVSGSDLAESEIIKKLRKDGARVKIGHKKGAINRKVGLVIYTKAAETNNPELRAARRLKITALAYSKAVGRLTKNYQTIAVAGAHGKSTTTALASLIIKRAGLDPTVIIGTNIKEFGNKNFRKGRDRRWLVLEADEFGKSFLDYSPAIATVTNIDLEHLDTYKNLADVKYYFLKFVSNTKNGGVLILNRDSKNLWVLRGRLQKIAEKKNYKILWYSLRGNTAGKIRKIIKISGEHNVSNAVAAYKIGRALCISHKTILSAIASYRGSWRRMEYRGCLKIGNYKLKIFDDYAHHPAEIKATLFAFRKKYPRFPIICAYQPHQALRLKKLWQGFIDSFADADVLILIPTYKVAGRDLSTGSIQEKKYNSKSLAAAIKRKYPKKAVYHLSDPEKTKRFLKQVLGETHFKAHNAVLVMMGAGNIVNYTKFLLK